LKYFLDPAVRRAHLIALVVFAVAIAGAVSARGELPSWVRNIDASSAFGTVFFE
jgi:hypothetical protein